MARSLLKMQGEDLTDDSWKNQAEFQ